MAGAQDATPQIRSFGPCGPSTQMDQDKTTHTNGGVWIAAEGFLLSGGGGMRHPGVRLRGGAHIGQKDGHGQRTCVLARMPSTTWRSVSGPTASRNDTRSPLSA